MRRAMLTVALGGVLLTGAACGTDSTPSAGGPAPAPSTPAAPGPTGPDYSEDTRKVCTAIGQVLDKNLGAFGAEMGKMIANKEAKVGDGAKDAKEQAQKQLSGFAVAIREVTAESVNPQMRAAGAQTADRLQDSAKDDKFYDGIKTTKDLEKALGPTMTQWLAPIQSQCV